MAWLENHLNLINTYSQALENLDNCKGKSNQIWIRVLWLLLRPGINELYNNKRFYQKF